MVQKLENTYLEGKIISLELIIIRGRQNDQTKQEPKQTKLFRSVQIIIIMVLVLRIKNYLILVLFRFKF